MIVDNVPKRSASYISMLNFQYNAIKIHGNTYCYDKSIYKNQTTKIEIICRHHGSFFQLPYHHIQGQGCPKCGDIKNSKKRTKTTNRAILDFQRVHGYTYNYSKMKYTSLRKKVKIKCNIHGYFYQSPQDHLAGKGCQTCGEIKKLKSKKIYNARLYYIKIKDRYKIGVTSKKIHKRFDSIGGKTKIENIYISDILDIDIAISVEQYILKKFKMFISKNTNILKTKYKSKEVFDVNIFKNPQKTINILISKYERKYNEDKNWKRSSSVKNS